MDTQLPLITGIILLLYSYHYKMQTTTHNTRYNLKNVSSCPHPQSFFTLPSLSSSSLLIISSSSFSSIPPPSLLFFPPSLTSSSWVHVPPILLCLPSLSSKSLLILSHLSSLSSLTCLISHLIPNYSFLNSQLPPLSTTHLSPLSSHIIHNLSHHS